MTPRYLLDRGSETRVGSPQKARFLEGSERTSLSQSLHQRKAGSHALGLPLWVWASDLRSTTPLQALLGFGDSVSTTLHGDETGPKLHCLEEFR